MSEEQYQSWNHFVPRMYLKHFASKPNHIWAYRCVASHDGVRPWSEIPIARAAAQKHLYSYAEVDGGESDRIERWLSEEFEKPADRVLNKAVGGERLYPADWKTLARFFLAQALRTPAFFIKRKDDWEARLPEALNSSMANLSRVLPSAKETSPHVTYAPNDEHRMFPIRYTVCPGDEPNLRNLHIEVVSGRKMWLYLMETLLRSSQSLSGIQDLNWTILTSPPGEPWHTSDDPAICFGPDTNGRWRFDTGIGIPGTTLMLPISPRHLLYAQVGAKRLAKYTEVQVGDAKNIRRVITDHALRSYFADKPYESVSRYRPRLIEASQYASEVSQLKAWHEEQSRAERFGHVPNTQSLVFNMSKIA